MPPLAVVGVTAAHGDWDGSLGALVLFLTNVLAILGVGIALFSAVRLPHQHHSDPRFHSRPVLATRRGGRRRDHRRAQRHDLANGAAGVVPAGTDVVVNRVAGSRHAIGAVQ